MDLTDRSKNVQIHQRYPVSSTIQWDLNFYEKNLYLCVYDYATEIQATCFVYYKISFRLSLQNRTTLQNAPFLCHVVYSTEYYTILRLCTVEFPHFCVSYLAIKSTGNRPICNFPCARYRDKGRDVKRQRCEVTLLRKSITKCIWSILLIKRCLKDALASITRKMTRSFARFGRCINHEVDKSSETALESFLCDSHRCLFGTRSYLLSLLSNRFASCQPLLHVIALSYLRHVINLPNNSSSFTLSKLIPSEWTNEDYIATVASKMWYNVLCKNKTVYKINEYRN